jgi:dTDP-4-dehydrorhamnose reductase
MAQTSIVITGSKGQLGSELQLLQSKYPHFSFTSVDVDQLDLLDANAVQKFFDERKTDFIVNCAAYTAVDAAEQSPDICFKVNADAVKTLATIAKRKNIRLIQISTDYVFDGTAHEPIDETYTPAPLSVYGKSKLDGENHALSILDNAYVIRTAWVYSVFGKNFVKSIVKLARDKGQLNIVADQIGTPTLAGDLADVILQIIDQVSSGKKDQPGIYHFTNEGVASWYDFADAIVKMKNIPCIVKPIKSKDYKTAAERPKFSLLDKTKIKQTFSIEIRHWTDALNNMLVHYKED